MSDTSPPEADPAPPPAARPEAGPEARPARARSARRNALWTLILAAATLGCLDLPWAGYGGGDGSWSGFDLIKLSDRFASHSGDISNLRIVEGLSIGLMALSLLRLIVPAGTAWLALVGGLALLGMALITVGNFFRTLNDAGAFAPDTKAGPVVVVFAAAACAVAACRGPGALRAEAERGPRSRPAGAGAGEAGQPDRPELLPDPDRPDPDGLGPDDSGLSRPGSAPG